MFYVQYYLILHQQIQIQYYIIQRVVLHHARRELGCMLHRRQVVSECSEFVGHFCVSFFFCFLYKTQASKNEMLENIRRVIPEPIRILKHFRFNITQYSEPSTKHFSDSMCVNIPILQAISNVHQYSSILPEQLADVLSTWIVTVTSANAWPEPLAMPRCHCGPAVRARGGRRAAGRRRRLPVPLEWQSQWR